MSITSLLLLVTLWLLFHLLLVLGHICLPLLELLELGIVVEHEVRILFLKYLDDATAVLVEVLLEVA